MDLFSGSGSEGHQPLAARMRPRTLDEFIGQDHLIGPGRLLRRAIQADRLSSVIFYGPPGTGKTTLARVIANHTKSSFITLNAVLAGVQQIREAIAGADERRRLYEKRTILFVDEVHRWNRSQQDALLPWVENGTIILIGATTENPFFEVNKALVSRSRVFQLKPLTGDDLEKAALAAVADRERGYGKWAVEFTEDSLAHLVETASGDARSLLNALELAIETSVPSWPPEPGIRIVIDRQTAEESIQKKVVLYDRDGDYHYDVISAFIKSLRGRDPDAALYWLARMMSAGESPSFIFRRMLISACEDTGLADPHAISVVTSCAEAFDRVGLPEGQYHLAHAALYLATAPKSNSSLAYFDALAAVEEEDAEVPNHLRDGNRDKEGFGHGQGYLYPHSYREHWVPQQYLPDTLSGRIFFNPSEQGYEASIRSDVLTRREIQLSALLEGRSENPAEILTFSPGDSRRDEWTKRLDSGKADSLLAIRNTITEKAGIVRHSRILVCNADDGLLVWTALRKAPEGQVTAVCRAQKTCAILEQYASSLDDLEKPVFLVEADGIPSPQTMPHPFELVLSRDPGSTQEQISRFVAAATAFLVPGGRIVFSVRVPGLGMRLSTLVEDPALRERISEAEKSFFSDTDNPLFSWDGQILQDTLTAPERSVHCETIEMIEPRRPSPQDIERWFDPEHSPYGAMLHAKLHDNDIQTFRRTLEQRFATGPAEWQFCTVLCTVTREQR
ncbi:MAG TPA: AAA family ATPase [Treponemataceae bacterium]|nr:AAA family ATPase [Treponemataceae bacterium]